MEVLINIERQVLKINSLRVLSCKTFLKNEDIIQRKTINFILAYKRNSRKSILKTPWKSGQCKDHQIIYNIIIRPTTTISFLQANICNHQAVATCLFSDMDIYTHDLLTQ